jgi:uncharacterized membrane-anchored protein
MDTVASKQQVAVPLLRQAAVKVPEVTAAFWVTKVLTTAIGETGSDFMFMSLNHAVALVLGIVGFTVAIRLQLRARRYVPWKYWLAVSMVAVFGTQFADVLHVGFGVPYAVSTAFFAVALAAIFAWWYAKERTLSIHSIDTRCRERFYWATVLATFALGTATGDLTATTLNLGYFSSGVVFAVVILVPLVAHRWLRLNAIVAFWFAYIITRPLGASFADWFAVTRDRGGLHLGAGPVTAVGLVGIIGLVVHLTRAERKGRPVASTAAVELGESSAGS